MNDLHKRWLMFLGFCIPSRYLIAYVLSKLSEAHLRIAGLVLLLPVLGFSYIYVTKSRMTGGETLGAPIWWDFIRPLHAGLYLVAALMALSGNSRAYIPILADTTLGLLAFLNYHF